MLRGLTSQLDPQGQPFIGDRLNLGDRTSAQLMYQAYSNQVWALYRAKQYGYAKMMKRSAIDGCHFPEAGFPTDEELKKEDPIR